MLKIKFNERPKDLIYVPEFFNHTYEDEWLYDKDVIQIVKDIDNSELKGQCVISPALGVNSGNTDIRWGEGFNFIIKK